MTSRLFFDSSALFSAAYSSTGGSRELFLMATQGVIELLVSQDVLDETSRNIQKKAPEKAETLHILFMHLDLTVVRDPTKQEVWEAEAYVAQKDAPIIAAVKNSGVDFFVTLDKQHLLDQPGLAEYAGTVIGTPKEALIFVRNME